MRLNKFESAGKEPLGEGIQKRSFADPKNEKRVIVEIKKAAEKDTHRQLKGRYYLTKIAHLLLPKNIPDIYQVGESRDGQQTIDVERIAHSPGHALLQKVRRTGGEEEPARKQIIEEMGREMSDLDLKLGDIGLGFNIDESVGNYTRGESGSVYYMETFKPWQRDSVDTREIEVLFNEEELRRAIKDVSNQKVKEKCQQYLDRLLALLEEEKQELQAMQRKKKESLPECGPYIKELEALIAPFMIVETLAALYAISTKEEARKNEERELAKKALILISDKLKFLEKDTTNITEEQRADLRGKLKILARAAGMIDGDGRVDHTR